MSLRAKQLNVIRFTKDLMLATRLLQLLTPFNRLFFFICNFNNLTSWIHKHKGDKMLVNDFYKPVRNYMDREKSFKAIADHYNIVDNPFYYMEFGVADGLSFKWWLANTHNPQSRYYGFDTFEGLPESWKVYAKGEMNLGLPEFADKRAELVKGIFQDTLNDFLFKNGAALKTKRKVIHMDADLFSATIFTLSQLYPYLQKGDIIMFDEFIVFDHEFLAFKYFTECFYVKLKPIAAQNNFHHAAFEVE